MSTLRAANRFAKALIDLARERGVMEVVKADADVLLIVLQESREFRVFLKSPTIKPDQKIKLLRTTFAQQLNEMTSLFLELLVKHGREAHLRAILEKYVMLYLIDKKVVRAQVTSATALTTEQKNQLMDLLKTPSISGVVLEEIINEDLIGGFVLRVGDKQVDASVAHGLRQIERQFEKNLYISDL